MIEVKHVTKTYGKKQNAFRALDDVNFEIPDGASVAIIGKSGSGKSTLMHAMSGLDRPEQGEVVIDGENILKLKQKAVDKFRAEKIGFIFQSFLRTLKATIPDACRASSDANNPNIVIQAQGVSSGVIVYNGEQRSAATVSNACGRVAIGDDEFNEGREN